MLVSLSTLVVGTSVGTLILGRIVPWHYSDFAATCRRGADASRRMRRCLDDALGAIHPVVRAAERLTDSTVALYLRLDRAHRVCGTLEALDDLFELRDNRLETELEACRAAIVGRVRWGLFDIIPALNQPGALDDPESAGRRSLEILITAMRDADIRACQRLIERLTAMSSWPGFARHRLLALGARLSRASALLE